MKKGTEASAPAKVAEAIRLNTDSSTFENKSLSGLEGLSPASGQGLISPLKGIITDTIKEALQPLLERIKNLEATIAQQDEKIAALEATQETHAENSLIQLRLIAQLRENCKKAPEEPVKTTQKTQDHITSIAVLLGAKEKRLIEGQAARPYLARLKREGMTFSEIANVLGLTVDRIRQLAKIASGDQRFNITWHPRKKNTKIIKLRRWDVQ